MASLNQANTDDITAVHDAYEKWKIRKDSYPEFLKNSIPYLLDTPITSSAKDEL
jgi:hypothetical protein